MTTTRTRFAPSPTGYMHIGGMRTALFNWLWARHNGGQFILRIDDTDQQRNVDAALKPILHAFEWLQLNWDEGPEVGGEYGPYFQSQRGELYQAGIERLLSENKAYRCFEAPEQIQADREAAQSQKQQYVNIRRSADLTESQIQQKLDDGQSFVVRFLVPRGETVQIDDAIRGNVQWDTSLISDPVIARADGSPLYNFATVIDDAAMRITDVIRAEEHLSNTPIQVLLHQALGNELPRFAHIPYVAAPGTKEKLSKRKLDKYRKNPQFKKMFERADQVFPRIGLAESQALDPVMVEYYEQMGYLPQGILNALARLGWSLDDRTEIMSLQTIVDNFTLDRVVKNPAGLDPDKLLSYQSHWMNELPLPEKVAGCLPFLVKAGYVTESPDESTTKYIGDVISAIGDRLKVFSDVLDFTELLLPVDQMQYDKKAVKRRLRKSPESIELLVKFKDQLAATEPFNVDTLDKLMHDFVDTEGINIGQIIHALRVAITGKSVGIGMFECMELLGHDSCLARIEKTLQHLEQAVVDET